MRFPRRTHVAASMSQSYKKAFPWIHWNRIQECACTPYLGFHNKNLGGWIRGRSEFTSRDWIFGSFKCCDMLPDVNLVSTPATQVFMRHFLTQSSLFISVRVAMFCPGEIVAEGSYIKFSNGLQSYAATTSVCAHTICWLSLLLVLHVLCHVLQQHGAGVLLHSKEYGREWYLGLSGNRMCLPSRIQLMIWSFNSNRLLRGWVKCSSSNHVVLSNKNSTTDSCLARLLDSTLAKCRIVECYFSLWVEMILCLELWNWQVNTQHWLPQSATGRKFFQLEMKTSGCTTSFSKLLIC